MIWSNKTTRVFMTVVLSIVFVVSAAAQGTQFIYQGNLKTGGVNANGSYDFIFILFDALSGGNQVGSHVMRNNVPVSDGQFTVAIDFGSQFPGASRFMQILVRQQPNIHTQLEPRQPINSAPYSIKSLNAENAVTSTTATNATQLGGVAANQFVVTGDARLSDARNPLPGSTNYIQNTTPGGGSGFNVTGTGSANIVDAATQFNLGGLRAFSNGGTRNLFAGVNAGGVNSGFDNAFFGNSAGQNNQAGTRNSFFGSGAGRLNTTGGFNSFFGASAGDGNTTGGSNSFFGNSAGLSNTTGSGNSIFGDSAGVLATTALNNSIFGTFAGFSNTGSNNTFVGNRSGGSNTIGESNTFLGQGAGQNNTNASQNSFVGMGAGMGNTTASFNTYLGFNAGFSNQTAPGNTFVGWRAGFMTTGSSNSFFGESSGSNNTTGAGNAFFAGGTANTTGNSNSFFGSASGAQNTTGSTNTFLGVQAGFSNTTGSNNVFIGFAAGNPINSQVSNSVAIGSLASVTTSNTIVLGTTAETTRVPGGFTSGYFNGPSSTPVIRGLNTPAGGGVASPNFYLTQFNQLASSNHLCWRAVVDGVIQGNAITNCSGAFASERYKEDLRPFTGGLEIIKRLQPMAFKWKADGISDIGLSAEDVAAIEPSLVTRTATGEAEDVNEHSLDVLFINAIKEQQSLIEAQQHQLVRQSELINKQRTDLDALRALVCLQSPNAPVCKPTD